MATVVCGLSPFRAELWPQSVHALVTVPSGVSQASPDVGCSGGGGAWGDAGGAWAEATVPG